MSMREAFDIFSKTTTSRGDVLGELSQGFLDVINTDKVRLSLQKMISLTNWNGCPNCRKKGLTSIRWKKIWNLEFTHKLKTF